jgi:sigma-B regulation protein RsbU (phosphoserine phosphatase)
VVLVLVLIFLRRAALQLQAWIDRRFFREAVSTERVLGELSEKVRTIVEAEPLLQTVTETISKALHVPRVAALVRHNGDFSPVQARGFAEPVPPVRIASESALVARLSRDRRALRAALVTGDDAENNDLRQLDAELLLPLAAHDRLLGFLSLGPKRSEAPYSANDLRLLEAVAAQTGLALENSRLTAEMAAEIAQRERMNRELEIAREVQQRLFPQAGPAVEGLDYAGRCRPASTIGGDYYDFVPVPGGRLGFAIGDISGKGIPAALLMASLQASLRGLAITNSEALGELMANLNRLIYEASSSERYATFFYGVYDPGARTFTYVNAGHNAPMLFRAGSGELERLEEGGPVIGSFDAVQYRQAAVELKAGDTLVMFTDGLSEAMNENDEEFGERRIVEVVRGGAGLPAAKLIDCLMRAADQFAAGAPQHDDMTLVVLRVC